MSCIGRRAAGVSLAFEAFLDPEPAMAMGPGRSRGPLLTPWLGEDQRVAGVADDSSPAVMGAGLNPLTTR